MARRKARSRDGDFLKRLFDEPAAGKSPSKAPSKHSRPEDSRAQLLAVLEAAGERPEEEGIVLDDALLSAYLDGALAGEEQVALEGLLARSADLRDQLAAAGAARAAAIGGGAGMPDAFIEDFDAVPGPQAGDPSRSPEAVRTSALPRWLASIVPGRRWAVVALPAVAAVVIVAVIGPGVYGPEKALSPKTAVGGALADKDLESKARSGKRRLKSDGMEAKRQARVAGQLKKEPQLGLSGAADSRRNERGNWVVASTIVPLDADLRAALRRIGLRGKRPPAVSGLAIGRADVKRKAAKPSAAESFAPKRPAKIAKERKRRDAAPKTEAARPSPSIGSMAQETGRREQPSEIDKLIEKCERSRIDPKLLQRLLAGGPPLQRMRVLHLSSKICLFTLPVAPSGK